MHRKIGLEFTMEAERRCKECTSGYNYEEGVYRPIIGEYCARCIEDFATLRECAVLSTSQHCYNQVSLVSGTTGGGTSSTPGGKRCSCGKYYCSQCIANEKGHKRRNPIIYVTCCNYVFCGQKLETIDETLVVQSRDTLLRSRPLRVRCVPYLCGWCQKCIECLRLDKYTKCQYKQCASMDCNEQICQLCCEEVFRTELRFCKACLKENGETHLLAVAQTLVPDAPAVGDIANDYAARGAIHFGSGVGSDSD